jgi:hypothetical protein
MTYRKSSIYCKQNLKEAERIQMEFLHDVIESGIQRVETYLEMKDKPTGSETVDKIRNELFETAMDTVCTCFEDLMQEIVISIIDNYSEEIGEVENPEYFEFPSDAKPVD